MTTETIARDAIGLFIEYRDKHGRTEDDALTAAVAEVVEGTSASAVRTPCPICPHWMELHNDDGTCGCGAHG